MTEIMEVSREYDAYKLKQNSFPFLFIFSLFICVN